MGRKAVQLHVCTLESTLCSTRPMQGPEEEYPRCNKVGSCLVLACSDACYPMIDRQAGIQTVAAFARSRERQTAREVNQASTT